YNGAYELPSMYAMIALAIAFAGPGALSLDALWPMHALRTAGVSWILIGIGVALSVIVLSTRHRSDNRPVGDRRLVQTGSSFTPSSWNRLELMVVAAAPAGLRFRLAVASFLGAIVGLERERTEHGAGLRTHVLVALGAALSMVVSAHGFQLRHRHARRS
ncbi:MAG: MgtC/SapB family protein, partial [Vulcanimicrobiaceae bacterium]